MATTIDVSEDAPPTSLSRDDIGSDDQSVIQAQALSGAVNLYSGNISTTLTRTAFSQVGVSNGGDVMGQTYRYDLLNRFVSSRAATGESVDAVLGMSGSDYAVTVGYDANSNITALSRTMAQGLQLDQMIYKYATEVKEGQVFKLNNRLLHINDAVTTPDLATDMEDQGSFSLTNPQSWNYQYDAKGRIISNRHDGVALIEYNAYGKVKRVVPTDNSRPTLEYTYDATQQRLSKKVIDADGSTTATYYAYDAMGVPMATYTHRETSESRTLTLNDFLLYGSGRLGSYQVNEPAGGTSPVSLVAANLRFELTDHLGTVRAVVTGQKTGTGNAEIVSLTDYYPYGMDMPGRSFQSEAYRYGYQGSERDPEMLGGAGYTTFFRALDPRIGRWLTPDPKVYPWQSPYVSMDGNPVAMVDPWGASTDGPPAGDYKDGSQSGSGTADDPIYSHGNIVEGSILLGDITVGPSAPNVVIPPNLAFRNDATQIVNRFIPDLAMQDVHRTQVDNDYAKNMAWLSKVGDFLTQFDENGNGDDLWQIYSEDGGQGQAIRAKGRPLLVDAKTLPFQMGLGRGFSGKSNILGGIKDLLGAAGLGANAFKNGHDTKLIDIAVEAVKGNAGADNKPPVRISAKKDIYVKIKFFIANSDVQMWASFDTDYAKNDTMGHVEFYFSDKAYSRIDSMKHVYRLKDGPYEW